MIRLIPGQHLGAAGGTGAILRPGRVMSLKVLSGEGGRWTVLLQGKQFNVASKIPLKSGDTFIVRTVSGDRGLELKLLRRLAGGSAGELGRMLDRDPEIVQALMRSGLSVREERIRKFRTLLGNRSGREREEQSRLLALLDEKGILPLFGTLAAFGERRDPESGGRDGRGSFDSWPEIAADRDGVRGLVLRRTAAPSAYALFNHRKSNKDNHWITIPLRIELSGERFSGELRLTVPLSAAGGPVRGGIGLTNEASGEVWSFAIDDLAHGSLLPIELPPDGRRKLADLSEKVRKLGLRVVDTENRGGFDGFTVDTEPLPRGIDAEA